MNITIPENRRAPLLTPFIVAIAIILGLSLWGFYLLMHPPMNDLGLMAAFLTITAIFSTLASYLAYRVGWIYHSSSIRWTLLGSYILSSLLIVLNVWITARLMFTSPHDLLLASVLLFFASGIAMVIGFFFSTALTDRIRMLKQMAETVAAGDLQVRLPTIGRDEIADLGQTFNQMVSQLQNAAQKQQQVENLRRDLIAWVSHDLQTPLASLRAIVEALADGVIEDNATIERYQRNAKRDVAALSALIDDLFQMAQLDAGEMPLDLAPNSLSDLVSDTLESLSELAKRQGITLRGYAEPGIDPVIMDVQRIGRVLNNLIGNALRHTPPGGLVEVNAVLHGNDVLVEVCDNGEGIPEADLPFVFDQFYRGEKSRNRATGGAGLGLAISRGIIEAHGGQINAESLPGQKTCLRFTLPKIAGNHLSNS